MINKIQIKFILITMFVILIIVGMIFSIVSYENYKITHRPVVDAHGQLIRYDLDRDYNNATVRAFKFTILYLFLISILITIYSRRILGPVITSIEKQKKFITNASHELKTPLAVVTADLDVLEMTVGEENEWVNSIRKQVTRLDVLVKSMLTLSHIEDGKKKLETSTFPVNDILKEQINDLKILAKDKKIVFEPKEEVLMEADKDLINQLIIILLDNAIKYTPDGGLIEVKTSKRGRKLAEFEIANTVENPKINTKKLFDRFYREDESHNHENKGYGIGLSIAKSIVDLHKGKIYSGINKKEMIYFRIII